MVRITSNLKSIVILLMDYPGISGVGLPYGKIPLERKKVAYYFNTYVKMY